MRFSRSDCRALVLIAVALVSAWSGIVLDRWLHRPSAQGITLDEARMAALEAVQGLPDGGPRGAGAGSGRGELAAAVVETFPFDPNTADSATLRRLGLADWQIRNIYRYRARGGRYHEPEDFKRLYGMTGELWQRLAPVIRIGEQFRYFTEKDFEADDARRDAQRARRDSVRAERDSSVRRYPVQPKFTELTQVDLNTADSTLLKQIPGIASYRARQILKYRDRLGGYVSVAQLAEIENFPADELAVWFKVEAPLLRRLRVNTASLTELGRHPYVGFPRARVIENYRRVHGAIRSLDELRLIPDFTDEVIQRLEPYLEY